MTDPLPAPSNDEQKTLPGTRGNGRRSPEMERLVANFVGHWSVTISNMRWVDDPAESITGTGIGEWLDDSFVRLQVDFKNGFPGGSNWDFVFGRNDARNSFVALYRDDRNTMRMFDVTLTGDTWTMSRADPDMHQRLTGHSTGQRISGSAEASQDQGRTWRTDLNLTFERTSHATGSTASPVTHE